MDRTDALFTSLAEEGEAPIELAPLLVPLASACVFSKAKWSKDVIQYVLCPYILRKQTNSLAQQLQALSEADRKKVNKETSRVLYHSYFPPSRTTNWVDHPAPAKDFVKVITSALTVTNSSSDMVNISVCFKDAGVWHYVPDPSNYEPFLGSSIIPQDGEWLMSTNKTKKGEVQSMYLSISFYDHFPSNRVFLAHFENRNLQRITIPITLSLRPPHEPQLPFYTLPASRHRHVFPSITRCVYKSVPYYRSVGIKPEKGLSTQLASLYAHQNLAKPIALHKEPSSPFVGYFLETTGASLTEWLRSPFPLTNASHPNLIELSKLQIIAEIAGALASIHAKKLVHGCLCLAAVFINAEFSAKLLWNCDWEAEGPSKSDIERNTAEWRYTAPELLSQRFPEMTPASDVFAFGVLLNEIIRGGAVVRSVEEITNGEVSGLGSWTDRYKYFISKPVSLHRYDMNYWQVMEQCLQKDPSARPKMSDVERALNGAFAQSCGDYDLFTANRSPYSVYCRATSEETWDDASSKLTTLKHLEYNIRGPLLSARKFVAPLESLVLPHAHNLSEKVMEVLPETLTTLFAPRLVVAGIEKLPPNLKELWIGSAVEVGVNTEGPQDDGSEPQPTRNGMFNSSSSAVSDEPARESKTLETSMPTAPKSVEIIRGRGSRSASAAPAVKASARPALIVRHFPPLLRVLAIEDLDVTTLDMSSLPKELEELRAGARSVANALDGALLPRNLTSLSLPGVARILCPASSLPPNLTLLGLANANVDSTWLENLPQKLQWLDIRMAPNPPNDASSWPTGLKYLDMSSASVSAAHWAVMSDELLNLETLKIKRFVLPSPHLNPAPPALAPPSLTHFEWTDGQGSVPQLLFSHILPDELTYLEFPNSDLESVHAVFSSLPPGLKTLIIPKVKQVVDTHIHLMPRGITHLSMAGATGLTDAGLRRLPRPLVYLDVSSSPGITDEVLPWLPDTLVHLELGAAVNWKNTSMKYLPRNLTYLNLSSAVGLTQDCLVDVPRSLTTFKTSNSGISAYFFRKST